MFKIEWAGFLEFRWEIGEVRVFRVWRIIKIVMVWVLKICFLCRVLIFRMILFDW